MNNLEQLKFEAYCAGKIRYETKFKNRSQAYADAYREFFSKVGDHPQFNLPDAAYFRYSRQLVDRLEPILSRDLGAPRRILELGCGRGFLTAELAQRFPDAKCVGVDVALAESDRFNLSNASYINANILEESFPIENADLVLADQVMEHFHVDDVDHFISTCSRATRPGGLVFIGTPNRLWGPHDISGNCRLREPIGFHLKEYNAKDVVDICIKHDLVFENAILMLRGYGVAISLRNYTRLERIIGMFPVFLRHMMRDKRLLGWANIRFLFKKN
jgi:SAM-dependent methyltransferase